MSVTVFSVFFFVAIPTNIWKTRGKQKQSTATETENNNNGVIDEKGICLVQKGGKISIC